MVYFSYLAQVDDGVVLPDKASLFLTAIEDADYKEDKIECKLFIYGRGGLNLSQMNQDWSNGLLLASCYNEVFESFLLTY